MIKKYILKNFQSHERTVLSFHPRVNVIVGESMCGKTALVRGMRLLIENRPSGTKYFPNQIQEEGTTVSKFIFDNETSVKISKQIGVDRKGEKKLRQQHYTINDKHTYSGFGSDVPDKVKEIINLSELNVQQQLELPFIVSTSATRIARIINEITGLENADRWQSTVNSRIRETSAKIRILKDEIERDESELEKYSPLDRIGAKVEQYKKAGLECDKLFDKIHEIKTAKEQVEEIQPKAKRIRKALEKLQTYRQQLRSIDEEMLVSSISELTRFIENENRIKKVVHNLSSKRKRYLSLFQKDGMCPFCFSKITSTKHIERHLK